MLKIPWPPLRHVFIPVYLNCWLAKSQLEIFLHDSFYQKQNSEYVLEQKLIILVVTLSCIIFTGYAAVYENIH